MEKSLRFLTHTLAEHGLSRKREAVLIAVWNSTDLRPAQCESAFYMFTQGQVHRVGGLKAFPRVVANGMAKEPWLTTLAAMFPAKPGKVWLRHHFTEQEQHHLREIFTSAQHFTGSMGCLFQAVAGLFERAGKGSGSTESVFALQHLAGKATDLSWNAYCLPIENSALNASRFLEMLYAEKKNGVTAEDLALRFHQTLVQWIVWMAATNQRAHVVLAGDIFQNTLLLDLAQQRLGQTHKLYFSAPVPQNAHTVSSVQR